VNEQKGTVERWDDQKGFGFIRSENNKPLYFHISVVRGEQRPQQGDKVLFVPGKDLQGRSAATHVRHQVLVVDNPRIRIKPSTNAAGPGISTPSEAKNFRSKRKSTSTSTTKKFRLTESKIPWAVVLVLIALPAAGVISVAAEYGAVWLMVAYMVTSFITYYFYWDDKRRAKCNEWRIPESNLHFWSLIGGWPGAFIAQRQFRHKTKKISFLIVYWLIVATHEFVWFDWLFLDAKWLGQIVGLPLS
jgi:uncharacterized membrane protein YsdA (DUF1294 family)/cold shock CspA family protein